MIVKSYAVCEIVRVINFNMQNISVIKFLNEFKNVSKCFFYPKSDIRFLSKPTIPEAQKQLPAG